MNGIINIYKEKGYTSNDVVCRLRGILHQKKIGHTGTLDPDATGVLPVCLGSATKLCELLTDHDKEYLAVMRLGITTDTQDISGQVLHAAEAVMDEQTVRKTVLSYVGTYEQMPPMYSALKVNGRKLYEYARAGITVERKTRTVTIGAIEILAVNLPDVTMRVACSKGTYIRTLCHDIGQTLGCGAAMASLERTRVGTFTVNEAVTLSEVEALRDTGKLEEVVLPVDEPLRHLPSAVPVDEQALKALRNGNPLKPKMLKAAQAHGEAHEPLPGGQLRLYDFEEHFLALYSFEPKRRLYMPDKMFLSDS